MCIYTVCIYIYIYWVMCVYTLYIYIYTYMDVHLLICFWKRLKPNSSKSWVTRNMLWVKTCQDCRPLRNVAGQIHHWWLIFPANYNSMAPWLRDFPSSQVLHRPSVFDPESNKPRNPKKPKYRSTKNLNLKISYPESRQRMFSQLLAFRLHKILAQDKARIARTFIVALTHIDIEVYPLVIQHIYWKWAFIVNLPIKNGDFP